MPVPSVITDLSATASSNSPPDTEQRTTADDYYRAHAAFIRQLYDTLIGGQFVFPSTQNASANANTLDDYEEGTWTPALTFGGGSTGLTYVGRGGRYIKVGRIVYAAGYIVMSAKGSSTGAAVIGGLPFTVFNDFARGGGPISYSGMISMSAAYVAAVANSTELTIDVHGTNATAGTSEQNFSDSTSFNFSLVYEASA